MGPMEPDKDEIRQEPLTLPDKFIWDDINLSDDAQVSPWMETAARILVCCVISPDVLSSLAAVGAVHSPQ